MSDGAARTPKSPITDEKLLLLLMAALGVLLLLVLLLWRGIDQQADEHITPVDGGKKSVWFDEHGIKEGPASAIEEGSNSNPETAKLAANTSSSREAQAQHAAVATLELGAGLDSALSKTESAPNYWVQLATFANIANADQLAQKVSDLAPAVEVKALERSGGSLYSVRVPVHGAKAEAENLSQQISKAYALEPLLVLVKP